MHGLNQWIHLWIHWKNMNSQQKKHLQLKQKLQQKKKKQQRQKLQQKQKQLHLLRQRQGQQK